MQARERKVERFKEDKMKTGRPWNVHTGRQTKQIKETRCAIAKSIFFAIAKLPPGELLV